MVRSGTVDNVILDGNIADALTCRIRRIGKYGDSTSAVPAMTAFYDPVTSDCNVGRGHALVPPSLRCNVDCRPLGIEKMIVFDEYVSRLDKYTSRKMSL